MQIEQARAEQGAALARAVARGWAWLLAFFVSV
jgi:hypothetical protein